MSWGIRAYDRAEMRELRFKWSGKFINSAVTVIWVDFFWNNALIDRVELARVNGGHGLIPVPDLKLQVSDFELAVAHLVHELSGGSHHERPGRHLDRIGATAVRDEPRHGAGSGL